MNKGKIIDKIQDIFRDIFDDCDLVINDSTSSEDIEDWDSLSQISLVTAIENEFEVKFTIEEFMSLKNVGEMIALLVNKLS